MTIAPAGRPSMLPRITDLAARVAAGETFAQVCAELEVSRATLSSRFTQAGFSTVTGLSVMRTKRTGASQPRFFEPWMQDAVCREIDADAFFPDKGDDHASPRQICKASCKVKAQCLDYAMRAEEGISRHHRHGIYGGMTPGQRAKHEPQWQAERAEAVA